MSGRKMDIFTTIQHPGNSQIVWRVVIEILWIRSLNSMENSMENSKEKNYFTGSNNKYLNMYHWLEYKHKYEFVSSKASCKNSFFGVSKLSFSDTGHMWLSYQILIFDDRKHPNASVSVLQLTKIYLLHQLSLRIWLKCLSLVLVRGRPGTDFEVSVPCTWHWCRRLFTVSTRPGIWNWLPVSPVTENKYLTGRNRMIQN